MTKTLDEFHGMGGSYIVDADGKRRLIERTHSPNQGDAPIAAVKVSEKSAPQGE